MLIPKENDVKIEYNDDQLIRQLHDDELWADVEPNYARALLLDTRDNVERNLLNLKRRLEGRTSPEERREIAQKQLNTRAFMKHVEARLSVVNDAVKAENVKKAERSARAKYTKLRDAVLRHKEALHGPEVNNEVLEPEDIALYAALEEADAI